MAEYRIREGWFGKSVLQRLHDGPLIAGGVVDASVRVYKWQDVPFDNAPRVLMALCAPEFIKTEEKRK